MTKTRPCVHAVILNWNKEAETRACIAALGQCGYPDYRVIVVDNGSTPKFEANGLDCVVVRNEKNLGFAGGVNVGLHRALAEGADFIWLLNNDARPLPGALQTLIYRATDNPRLGLLSPVILNGDAGDVVEFHGGIWSSDGTSYQTTKHNEEYFSWLRSAPDRIWLVGTALLVRRSLVEEIGDFDENLFAYWEDNDYSRRSVSAGFLNEVVPGALVRHHSGCVRIDASAKPPYYFYYMARNEILLHWKHGTLIPRPLLWAFHRQFGELDRLTDLPDHADALLLGLWDGLCNRGGVYHPRRFPLRATISRLCKAIGVPRHFT
jgi:GT2 family glycosyltransferase